MGVIVSNGLHQLSLISLKPTTTNKTSSFHGFVDLWKCGRLATVVGCGARGTSDLHTPSRVSSLCRLWIFRAEIPQNEMRKLVA